LVPKIHNLVRENTTTQPTQPIQKPAPAINTLSRVVYESTPVLKIDKPAPAAPNPIHKQPEIPVINQTPNVNNQAQQKPVSQATFSNNLPIPRTPTTPNMVVGMTLTPDGKILESAVIDIRLQGSTIRATKSNKLGQFMFAKPLDNGQYHITAEKMGFTFPVFNLPLDGKVIPPVKLQATTKR
jgi:hypothetical protein